MQTLRDYLLAQPRPIQIIKWLHMGPRTDLLRNIATERVPIETVLDAARADRALTYHVPLLFKMDEPELRITEQVSLRWRRGDPAQALNPPRTNNLDQCDADLGWHPLDCRHDRMGA